METNNEFSAGIAVFEAAGYKVKVSDNQKTFSLWEGENKLRGYSTTHWLLNLPFILNEIKDISYRHGIEKGSEKVRQDFKKLLDI